MDKRAIRNTILALSIPASLEAVLQMALNFIDQVVVARLGERAIAGVGLTGQLIFLVTLVFGTLGASVSILVAQHFGRHDAKAVVRVTGTSLWIGALVSTPIAAGLMIFPEPMLRQMGADEAVVVLTAPFLRWVSASIPFGLLGTLVSSALRSLGDSRTPMLVTLAGVGLNTALNFALVFGVGPIPALGVAGAALATLASQVFRLIALLYLLRLQKQVSFQVSHLSRLDRATAVALFQLTYPIALVELFWAGGGLVYTLMCARLGTGQVVATQIINATESVFIVFSSGLSVAALTLVGQEIGAGNLDAMRFKARQVLIVGLQSSLLFGLLMASCVFWVGFFFPEVSAEVLKMTVMGLLINALFQPAKVLNMILGNGVLRGGGDTRFLLGVDVFSIYAVGVPAALLLAFPLGLGFLGVVLGRLGEEVARIIIFLLRYRTPHWYRSSTITPAGIPSLEPNTT